MKTVFNRTHHHDHFKIFIRNFHITKDKTKHETCGHKHVRAIPAVPKTRNKPVQDLGKEGIKELPLNFLPVGIAPHF